MESALSPCPFPSCTPAAGRSAALFGEPRRLVGERRSPARDRGACERTLRPRALVSTPIACHFNLLHLPREGTITAVMEWSEADGHCGELELCGENDWRVPSISELRPLIRGCPEALTDGACGVDDDCLETTCAGEECDGCASGAGPDDACYRPTELSGPCSWTWSSSTNDTTSSAAWMVEFDTGGIASWGKGNPLYVRCVRDS
jgi:hypothetical protein